MPEQEMQDDMQAMRHPQRYTRPLFEAHEAAQAAEHAWYAGPYARPAPLPAASMPLPAGQSLPSASPFAQQAGDQHGLP